MNDKTYPLVTVYGVENKNGVEFLFPGHVVAIEGEKETLFFLLQQCTGYRTTEEIVSIVCEQTRHDEKEVQEVVEELLARHILVDANHYYFLFHRASENPMPFFKKLSDEDVATIFKEGESPLVPFPSSQRF